MSPQSPYVESFAPQRCRYSQVSKGPAGETDPPNIFSAILIRVLVPIALFAFFIAIMMDSRLRRAWNDH